MKSGQATGCCAEVRQVGPWNAGAMDPDGKARVGCAEAILGVSNGGI